MRAFSEKSSGIITSLDLKKRHVQIGYWCLFALLAVISTICLFPPLWVFMSSFKDLKEFLTVPPTIIPRSFHPEKVIEVWKTLRFATYYRNTIVMAIGELIFCIFVNGLAGYVISRLRPKGASLYYKLVLWTMMLPASISMVPLFKLFIDFPWLHFSMLNTYVPMWLMAGANAFNVMLFKNFFDTIPDSYVEAARIDGCSDLGIFAKIIMPLSVPILIVVAIFSVNFSWEAFFWPYLVIRDKKLDTVAVQLFKMKSSGFSEDKYMIALLFSILPPALVFIFFQKYMIQGITMSGIKG
ncbi:MAG: carbohydrate ABC transporter permease [Firmicutes bacterium]|nr:carbohydrate ABC transporter permease [Bacillota bacterium]